MTLVPALASQLPALPSKENTCGAQISDTAPHLEAQTTEVGVSSVVVCGGGVVGLCTAMMLARDGLDVTMFEADPAEPPAPVDAWSSWTRKGVAQFRQPHNLFGRFRQICDDELPGLTDKLLTRLGRLPRVATTRHRRPLSAAW
jgi:FAD dependent oxidoreductase